MREGWIKIFASSEEYQARIADDVLKQHGIESLVVSKPDSAIPSIGQAELYTPAEKAEEARRILREEKLI
jgi:hypothetical protein